MIADARHHLAPKDIAGFDPTRLEGDCWYDGEVAEKAVQFFPDTLVHLDGPNAGEPFHLEPWQADVIRTAFGWKRKDGSRRFRQIFWFIPRKNGKTTIAAGMALRCFYGDGERRARCYCAACDKDQAALLFDISKDYVLASPTLSGVSKVSDHYKRIVHKDRYFRALAASDSGGHGMNLHFGAYDEFHLWRTSKHVEMFESLHTSTGNRPQPLELIITTAGWDRLSLCFKEYQKAVAVRDGRLDDDALLPVIYEAGEDDDWTDPEVWRKANPNLGITISEDYIRRECERAKVDAAYENTFRRLHLNQWTSQESRWLKMSHWRACPISSAPFDKLRPVFGGLDLSAVDDFTAWMLLQDDGEMLRCRGHYFIPEAKSIEYQRQLNLPITQWVRDGWLTLIPSRSIEHSYVHARIKAATEETGVQMIGFDPWNMAQLRQALEGEGYEMEEVRQGYGSLSGPSKELYRRVLNHTLDWGGDPILEWMADNAVCKYDENQNIRPVKQKGNRKIDGIVALIMAIHAMQTKEPTRPSVYETAGALTL